MKMEACLGLPHLKTKKGEIKKFSTSHHYRKVLVDLKKWIMREFHTLD
jgi:hypothetical protein